MSHADIAGQAQHVTRLKYVANQAIALAHVQAVLTPGDDPRRILPPVLQDSQCIVERLVNRAFPNNSDNSAHAFIFNLPAIISEYPKCQAEIRQ